MIGVGRHAAAAADAPLLLMLLCAATTPLVAQPAIITGRVTTEFGGPLPAANVFVSETGIVVSADADGRYRITIPSDRVRERSAILRARSIGYVSQEKHITISPGTLTHDFVLRRDSYHLEAVVVTGTVAATEQKKLPFRVTLLDTSDIPVGSVNPLQQLQGKVPGAHVVQSSGRPGAATAIVLRGPKSIDATDRSQEPLYIVDGIILNSGVQEINTEDIESVEVVNGAAGSSLYGSRAGAGVIQITTKRARLGPEKTSFVARRDYGFSDIAGEYRLPTRHFLMMDERNERFCLKGSYALGAGTASLQACSRVTSLEDEARRINETPTSWSDSAYQFERDYGNAPRVESKGLFQVNRWPTQYDPISAMLTNQAFATNTLNMTTRSGRTAYFGSVSDIAEDGAIRFLRGYHRRSARLNVDHAVSDAWTVSLNSTFSRSTQSPASSRQPVASGIEDFTPATRVPAGANLLRRDNLGRLYVRASPLAGSGTNILYDFENQQGGVDVDRLVASVQAHYAAADWLRFDATAGADRRRSDGELFLDKGYRTTGPIASGNFWGDGYIDRTSTADLSHNLALGAHATFGREPEMRGAITSRYTYEQQDVAFTEASGRTLIVPGVRTLGNATTNQSIASTNRSIRATGALAGVQVELRQRYILDGLLRYDGSSLFGSDERWHGYSRASGAWRISEESFWPRRIANEVKLRASVGTAGGRPNFAAQYETFVLAAGGLVKASSQQGNKQLKPETTLETEVGVDAELFSRFGLSLTYARDITRDQILPIPTPSASGFPSQWLNAGTLDGKTWELSLLVPIVRHRSFAWSSRLIWDRNRTHITALNREPFAFQTVREGGFMGNGIRFLYAPGERYGTMWGWQYATQCSQLPVPFDAQCGAGKEWQTNDEGYVVWAGAGHTPGDGVALNLWQAERPGCMANGETVSAANHTQCQSVGGTVNSPWGLPTTHWGMPTLLRDSTGQPAFARLGNTLPDYHVAMSHSVQWRKLSAYGLIDVSIGGRIFNQERQWSYLQYMNRDVDQDGKTPATAKPIGYYWRAGPPENVGVGGFYGQLVANNRTVEDGSYAKLRELTVSYEIGRVPGVGQWTVSAAARNLYTWTRYTGWDPEGGVTAGPAASAAITAGSFFQYPQTRTFAFGLASRF